MNKKGQERCACLQKRPLCPRSQYGKVESVVSQEFILQLLNLSDRLQIYKLIINPNVSLQTVIEIIAL